MSALPLTTAECREFRAQAHHLQPVVSIGSDGLTAAVIREVNAALNAHGLIKVRAHVDDRDTRTTMLQQLADELSAGIVQHIGKLLVLWRPLPIKEKVIDPLKKPGPKTVKVIQNSSRGGQRPEVKRVKVLGNQRLTASGKIKRAKSRTTSVKKKGLG
jgi:RNA-binding protein